MNAGAPPAKTIFAKCVGRLLKNKWTNLLELELETTTVHSLRLARRLSRERTGMPPPRSTTEQRARRHSRPAQAADPMAKLASAAPPPLVGDEIESHERTLESFRRTSSPSGRLHDDAQRRADLRLADPWSDVSFFASSREALSKPDVQRMGGFEYGLASGPSGDVQSFSSRQTTTQGWISVQAWLESLRYYPKTGRDGDDGSTTQRATIAVLKESERDVRKVRAVSRRPIAARARLSPPPAPAPAASRTQTPHAIATPRPKPSQPKAMMCHWRIVCMQPDGNTCLVCTRSQRVGAAVADPAWRPEQLPVVWSPNTIKLARRDVPAKKLTSGARSRAGSPPPPSARTVRASGTNPQTEVAAEQPPQAPGASASRSRPADAPHEDGTDDRRPGEAGESAMGEDDGSVGDDSRLSRLALPRRRYSQERHLHTWEISSRRPDFRHLPIGDARRDDPPELIDAARTRQEALDRRRLHTAYGGGAVHLAPAHTKNKDGVLRKDSRLFRPLSRLYLNAGGRGGGSVSSREVRL